MRHTCKRCESTIQFKTDISYTIAIHNDRCRKCKDVPDNSIPFFKSGKFSKTCPTCNLNIFFKNKEWLLYSINKNSSCKSCASRATSECTRKKVAVWRKNLTDSKRKEINRKKSNAHLKRLSLMSSKERTLDFKRRSEMGKNGSRIFVEKLKSPKFRAKWIKNLKLSFEKYKGDNHWTKRPEVLAKIIKSCEKYKGDNHWTKRSFKRIDK